MKTEGYIKRYQGFVRGYKKCFTRIKGNYIIIQKSERNKDGRLKLDMREELLVEPYSKDASELVITYNSNQKSHKLHLKTKTEQDRDEWL